MSSQLVAQTYCKKKTFKEVCIFTCVITYFVLLLIYFFQKRQAAYLHNSVSTAQKVGGIRISRQTPNIYHNLHHEFTPESMCLGGMKNQSQALHSAAQRFLSKTLHTVWEKYPEMHENHIESHDIDELWHTQACQYAALDRFQRLAMHFNITYWSAGSGTILGLFCYNAMIPWDDDIDIVTDECDKLESIFMYADASRATVVSDARFDGRVLDDQWDIFRYKAPFLVPYYKLRHRRQHVTKPLHDINGMDIECVDRISLRELYDGNVKQSFLSRQQTFVYEFGPSSIMAPSFSAMERYLHYVYPPDKQNTVLQGLQRGTMCLQEL